MIIDYFIRNLLHSVIQDNPNSKQSLTSGGIAQGDVAQSQPDISSDINTVSPIPLNRSDYPHIKFWFKQDWIDGDKKRNDTTKLTRPLSTRNRGGKGAAGENVSMRYIENHDGTIIDGFRASEMRRFARSIWIHLANRGKAPKSWGKADVETAQHYRQEMVRRYPELRLCAFDWKADQIATDNYPNWAANNLGTKVKIKNEGDIQSTPAKRPQSQSATSSNEEVVSSKRIRISTTLSSDIHPTEQQGTDRHPFCSYCYSDTFTSTNYRKHPWYRFW